MAFSFYDVLNEADDDNIEATPAADNTSTNTEDLSDMGSEDDFNIDTTLDDSDMGEEDDTSTGEDDLSSGSDDMESGEDAGAEEEENEDDKDIFYSLPKEEQQMKIRELKRLYGSLYSSCLDLLGRLDDMDVSDENMKSVCRISEALTNIKSYIADYIINIFPAKSFIENDITFNTYLMIINSITEVLDKVITREMKDREGEIEIIHKW